MAPDGNLVERSALAQAAGKDHSGRAELSARRTIPDWAKWVVLVVVIVIVVLVLSF
jgi:t-SNARE complex subunit (syntaxin)